MAGKESALRGAEGSIAMQGGWRGSGIASGSIEERTDHCDGFSGAFFHEPVAGVGDHSLLNVGGDVAE